MDGAIGSLDALVPIVDAVKGKLTIGFDGGIRCGADMSVVLHNLPIPVHANVTQIQGSRNRRRLRVAGPANHVGFGFRWREGCQACCEVDPSRLRPDGRSGRLSRTRGRRPTMLGGKRRPIYPTHTAVPYDQ